MVFKNKNIELVRSLRKLITGDIPRAKISFYEINKVGSNLKIAQNLGGNTSLKCLMGKRDDKRSLCWASDG